MRADEMRDAGRLAGRELGRLADLVRDVHLSTAARLCGLAGRPGRGIGLVHDGISAIAHGSTELGVRYLPPITGLAAAAFADPAAESAHDRPRQRAALGVISGLRGDQLDEAGSALAPPLRMRLHGGRLRRLPANLADDAARSRAATGRLVVFAHGLCETDRCWSFAAERRWGDRTVTYGSLLRDDDGWTPLYLNFNSGRHVSANALEVAEQLEQLVSHWPVDVTEIALVGHSLGGLVARSAAQQAHTRSHAWVRSLRHVVGLGTPHLGAPLERFANWGTHRLARHAETRPFATWLNGRSVAIKDLRYGALLEDDWLGFDPDDRLTDHCTPATLLPGVAYSMASATLSATGDGILAHDLLVQHSSAHGVGAVRSIPFEPERTFHVGRRHHLDLLADPRVYAQLRAWLAGADGADRA